MSSAALIAECAPQTAVTPQASVSAWSDEELLAARELRLRSRTAQGLPERIEDPVALQRAADLLRPVRPRR